VNLIYAAVEEAEQPIVILTHRLSREPVVTARNECELVELARVHRPKVVLMFMPGRAGVAVEIQNYLREFLPRARVRILPATRGTESLLPAWKKVVVQAFRFKVKQSEGQLEGRS
jgi:hypothetical protein